MNIHFRIRAPPGDVVAATAVAANKKPKNLMEVQHNANNF